MAFGDIFCVSSIPVTSVTSFLLRLCCWCNTEEKDQVCVNETRWGGAGWISLLHQAMAESLPPQG